MSAIEKLEQRLTAVEAELAQMKDQLQKSKEPWWKEWMGAFQDDPYFEEAMKYAEQWRRGQRPKRLKKKRKSKS